MNLFNITDNDGAYYFGPMEKLLDGFPVGEKYYIVVTSIDFQYPSAENSRLTLNFGYNPRKITPQISTECNRLTIIVFDVDGEGVDLMVEIILVNCHRGIYTLPM